MPQKRRAAVLFATLGIMIVMLSCQAILGIEDTRDDPTGINEDASGLDTSNARDDGVSHAEDGGDQLDPTDAEILLPADSGVDDDGGEGTITPDASCSPTSTFIPVTGATGTVCNPNSALPNTVGSTGLDFTNNVQKLASVDGRNVTACSGVKFPKEVTQVVVRVAAVAKACDKACVGSFCGTGRSAAVFAVTSGGNKYLGTASTTGAYADFKINVPATLHATQIFVCRTGWSGERDDVAISSIYGTCVP
jgi:hypothetical protein